MNKSLCKSPECRAEITFARNAKTGSTMVFDAQPKTAWVIEGDPPVARAVQVRVPHHSTCKDPASFRRPA